VEHGASRLRGVTVDAYNAEIRDGDGFVGDKASNRAFHATLTAVRERMAVRGHDPLGSLPHETLDREATDLLLRDGPPDAAAVVLTAIEEFAHAFEAVVRRFMALPEWANTERIAVGGGLRDSRAGELAIGRAQILLATGGLEVELVPIRHDPDEAGLVGGVHLVPEELAEAHDSILALDIGGTNVRAGVVPLDPDPKHAEPTATEHWTHGDANPTRDEAVAEMVAMLARLAEQAGRDGRALAPFVAVGCPGVIAPDGRIKRGGQNLPGNWEHEGFNLPDALRAGLPRIGGRDVAVVMHNDAVVQGLSALPHMRDVRRWGVMTIGTGLGNARFTNL
jgi:hypothetical protein